MYRFGLARSCIVKAMVIKPNARTTAPSPVKARRNSIENPPPNIMVATAIPAQKASSSLIITDLTYFADSRYRIFNTYELKIQKHGIEATLNVKAKL